MTTLKQLLAISSLTILSAASQSAYAMLPNCQSASSDSDGDGYGWENNASCLATAQSTAGSSSNSGGASGNNGTPACASASSDSDGDGYGWENGASCLVGSGSTTSTGSTASSGSTPSCASAGSDSDGDGYGCENGASSLVTASTGGSFISDDASNATSNGISDDAGSSTSNGISDDAGSSTSNGAATPTNGGGNTPATPPTTTTPNNDGGSFVSNSNGNSVIRSSSLPGGNARSASVSSSGGDLFATMQVGDYLLMQNAWRSWRAAPGYQWSQSISTDTNGAPVGWSYDWGPGIPGANGRASDDFYVRSYPELIYGIKDEFRTSALKAEIGFPVRVDQMPTVQIDYSYNAPQYGTSRAVDASASSRFPNGTIIQGERNVAVESFLYTPTGGVCDDNLSVTRNNGSNHVYEVMVWLDSGAERLPAASNNYVTTVSLRGASYDVYTKTSDNRYIAFVAKNPQNAGNVVWNDFMDWARQNAHRVQEQFGARSNSVQIQDSWCVANIIVGTEIFWGAGNVDFYDWTITQSQ